MKIVCQSAVARLGLPPCRGGKMLKSKIYLIKSVSLALWPPLTFA